MMSWLPLELPRFMFDDRSIAAVQMMSSMAIANYQGPRINNTAILEHLVGEQIYKAFVDNQGHLYLVVQSGYALKLCGFDSLAPAWEVLDPAACNLEVERRRGELQSRIADIRRLAPGVDL